MWAYNDASNYSSRNEDLCMCTCVYVFCLVCVCLCLCEVFLCLCIDSCLYGSQCTCGVYADLLVLHLIIIFIVIC